MVGEAPAEEDIAMGRLSAAIEEASTGGVTQAARKVQSVDASADVQFWEVSNVDMVTLVVSMRLGGSQRRWHMHMRQLQRSRQQRQPIEEPTEAASTAQ